MKKSDITKDKILVAAEAIFAKKGLYGARVDEISELAGVNKRMLYAHYQSKEGLYIAVLDNVYSRLAENEKKLLSTDMDCVDAIKSIIKHYFTFLNQNPTFVKILMWENLNEGTYLKESAAPKKKGIAVELLRTVLQKGINQGIFRITPDIDEMIVSINMFCFSYFSNIYTMSQIMQMDLSRSENLEKRCTHVTDIILNYLLGSELND